MHFLFNPYEVIGSERFFAQKFVEKAVIDRRANAELHVGIKLHHGSSKEVCRGMAENKKRVGILVREDFQLEVLLERAAQIDQVATVVNRITKIRERSVV